MIEEIKHININIIHLKICVLVLAFSTTIPTSYAQGAAVTAAKGIAKLLFKKGGSLAGEQAIKTATESAVKAGMPMPVEEYDLSHSFQRYNEQTWGVYRVNLPYRDLSVGVDPASTTQYSLEINGNGTPTGPVWFPEAKRNYHCTITPGYFEFHCITALVYRGRCQVVTPNLAHAVNQHNAKVFVAGAMLQSDCNPAPDAWNYQSIPKSIGRGSYADFWVTTQNFQMDYQYIYYE